MRDNIIKKRVRADEVVTKPVVVNRELQKLQNGSEQPQDEHIPDWNSNDLSGEYQSDSHTCPSCFKTFDRKAVYTSHVQACSDAKCREKSKMKKRKAKEETKTKQPTDFEENSNASEQSVQQPVGQTPDGDVNVNKRKRKRTNKVKREEVAVVKNVVEQEESSSVDWNLDDEEEKKKLENIKKEIIEDDYKRVNLSDISLNVSANTSLQVEADTNDEDDEPKDLVIDEKVEEEPKNEQKCPQCDKVFDTDEKLKYHLNTYHSRQKRFKCKMCEYQGYRKKDTINHLNCVHNVDGDKETLEKYMESVMKAVDEESLAKQNELKKNQLKIKRKLARERLKMNGSKEEKLDSEAVNTVPKIEVVAPPAIKIEFKEPAPVVIESIPTRAPKVRRKSLHTSILVPHESDSADDTKKIPKMFIKAKIEEGEEKKKKRRRRDTLGSSSPQPGQSLLNISKFGKIVKRSSNGESKDGGPQRPIRNRIKPVRKDFVYDLSDLLKKDADAHREQAVQSAAVGFKRELRKRTMSTNTRDIPDLSSFDDSSPEASTLLAPPRNPTRDEDIPHLKFKDPRNRRMSVYTPPSRSMYPRSPVYKPPPEPSASHPNAGAAYKMAVREFNSNQASLYEPKFLWSICFDQEDKTSTPLLNHYSAPTTSTAASILQKLSGKMENSSSGFPSNISKSKSFEEKSTSSMSADQLCSNFDMINVTSMSENELDIPESRAINLNPGRSSLVALALEGAGKDVCVLQECSPESDDDDDDDDEKPSSSSTEEPKQTRHRKRSKKNSEKRKAGSRLTVMQRLQENKIRKSREQLFKRLIMDRQNDDENPSPVYNLFSES